MKVTASMFDDKNKTLKECLDEAKKKKYKQVKPLEQTRDERMEERVIKSLETKT